MVLSKWGYKDFHPYIGGYADRCAPTQVDANDAAAAKEAGAARIPKSASPDELIATLRPLLRKE